MLHRRYKSEHGFLPRRSRLSNLILQEERVTRLLDEGHTCEGHHADSVKGIVSLKETKAEPF